MTDLEFIWDDKKAEINLKKHGVSFFEAKSVFYDDEAKLISDDEHSNNEGRFILLGLSLNIRILIVCHCYRQDESVIRIISARKATKQEQSQYWRKK